MALATSIAQHLKLDSNSNDSVGSNNGTDTSITYTTGKIGNCASFNGSSSKIVNPYNIPFGDFSINTWVNFNNNTGDQNIISGRGTGNSAPILSVYNSAGLYTFRLRSNASTGIKTIASGSISSGAWHMVTATYNNSTGAMILYVDGEQVASDTYSGGTWSNINATYLGNDYYNGEWMNGYQDELSIWTRPLSFNEIRGIYNKGTGIVYSTEVDVVSTNNADSFIRSQTPTTNLGTDTTFSVQGDTSQTYRALARFTLPAISGSITSARLYLYVVNKGTNSQSGNIEAHELTQTGWTETGVTYDKYDGTNNWSSAGGDFSSTIIHKISNPTTTGWKTWDLMGGSADNPLSLSPSSVLNLLLKYQTEGTSSSPDDYTVFYTKEYAVDTKLRPYIELIYTTTVSITVNPSVQSITFSVPSYTTTATRSITVSPTVQSITFSVPSYTASTSVSVSPAVQSITFSVPTYTVVADGSTVVSPSVQSITFSIPTYTIDTVSNITISPSVQAITFSLPVYTITTVANITISPSVFTITFSIPTYTVLGDYWEEKFSNPSTSWSDKNPTVATSWNNKY